MKKRKIGEAPYLEALIALANPVGEPKDLPDELPGEIWAAARLGLRRPNVGQWLFDFADHPEAIGHLNPSTRKKHREWARIATGHLCYAMAGWSSPTGRVTIYLVDRETRRARQYAGSVDQLIRFIVEDPEEREHDTDGAIAAIEAAVAPSAPAAQGWFSESKVKWYAPVVEPPPERQRAIATKAHERWLWHRGADVLVSVMRDGVRVLGDKGKGKTLKFPFPKGASVNAALSARGDAVGVVAGSKVARLDLATRTWSTVELDWKSYLTGLASLRDDWFVVAERYGSKSTTTRLRAFRWTADGWQDEVFLTSDDLPEYPQVYGAAELPIALVSCYPSPTALVVALVDGKPAIAGVAPHPVSELRRDEDGWRVGAAKAWSHVAAV